MRMSSRPEMPDLRRRDVVPLVLEEARRLEAWPSREAVVAILLFTQRTPEMGLHRQ